MQPKYRDSVKGNVREIMQDSQRAMTNEIVYGDSILLSAEDCAEYEASKDFLTHAELVQCFKRAQKAAKLLS